MRRKAERGRRTSFMAVVWRGLCVLVSLMVAHADHAAHAEPPVTPVAVTKLLDIYECTRCHRLTSPHRLIGPSLWKLSKRLDMAAIRAALLTPDAIVTPGYPAGLMQKRLQDVGFYEDIARQPAILERLVAYLAGRPVPLPMSPGAALLEERMASIPDGLLVQSGAPGIEIPAFAIDSEPITKAQFAAFIAAGGYTAKRYWNRTGWSVVIKRRKRTQPLGWHVGRDPASTQPVVGISWYEADAYCRWVGKTLPSAQQWERACQKIPTWSGLEPQAERKWEWTADAIWKGGQEPSDNRQARCAARVPSHRALDGRYTGFRCRARTIPAASSLARPQPAAK